MATQPGVKPIIVSNVAWTEFLKDAAELCGHSPTHGIDSYTYKLSDYARCIASFGEFREGKKCDPKQILYFAGDLLSHLHFGFIITGSAALMYDIMELTDLKIISTKSQESRGRVAIVTGTLQQWHGAVVNVLTTKRRREIRSVFSQCFDFFQHLGLHDVWYHYRKRALQDQTYLLEEK